METLKLLGEIGWTLVILSPFIWRAVFNYWDSKYEEEEGRRKMELELTKKEYHILLNGLAYYLAFRNGKENRIKDEEITDLSRWLMEEMFRQYPYLKKGVDK